MTYEKYCGISDRDHIKKILNMPVHFWMNRGKAFSYIVTMRRWHCAMI